MTAIMKKIDIPQIPKFDGTNFHLWKFSVSILLKTEKLMQVVNGIEKEPHAKYPEEWRDWNEKNYRAQLIFVSTICEDQMQNLINCINAKDMWNTLISLHEQKLLPKEEVWRKFYEYQMNDSEKISEHIANIKFLVTQLKSLNEVITEKTVITKIMNSLPAKYNTFKTAWDSVIHHDQTLDNLNARLLREEARLSQSETETIRFDLQTLQMQIKSLEHKLSREITERNKMNKIINDLKKKPDCTFCKNKDINWNS